MVSFSTGRTSGYMLKRVVEAHGGRLPDDVVAIFANTGKEREESLEFGAEVERALGVPIAVVERPPGGGFRVVTWESASRNGEPFSALIEERKFLPNPVTRYCTTELKIRVMRDYLRSLGWSRTVMKRGKEVIEDNWTNVVGLRADEPRRVAKMRERAGEGQWSTVMPLNDAGVSAADVDAFWSSQPFDLRLRSWEGNCDLCFLKGSAKRQRIMHDRPDLVAWWAAEEAKRRTAAGTAAVFRSDSPSYERLYDVTTRQLRMFEDADASACGLDDIGDCVCSDWQEAA